MESGGQSASAEFAAPRQNSASASTTFESPMTSTTDMDAATAAAIAAAYGDNESAIRAPDPSKRQRLVGAEIDLVRPRHLRDQHRDFAAESIAAITGGGISTAFGGSGAVAFDEAMNSSNGGGNERVRDLSTLFQPPTAIMFQGTYAGNYWASEHGKKFCSLYQIDRDSLPIVVIIDPRTGEIRHRLSDYLEPQDMIEKCTSLVHVVSDFCCMQTRDDTLAGEKKEVDTNIMDASEDDQLAAAIAASMEGNNDASDEDEMEQVEDVMDQEEKYGEETAQEPVVTLTPEPDAGAPGTTRVQIRVPDGSRLTRRFVKTDPLAMVWSFVKDQVPEARERAFELRTAFPPRVVAYNDTLSIQDGKLENASLMVKWL
uniref:UBX domain-containing protein n=1 Tax=Hyaloperonospora arabidopsidis (strain Emoy2) TaxID=559515 RepID=M4BXY9_HYAAE